MLNTYQDLGQLVIWDIYQFLTVEFRDHELDEVLALDAFAWSGECTYTVSTAERLNVEEREDFVALEKL
jgi:hypothetical protein